VERASTRWGALFFVLLILIGVPHTAVAAPADVIDVPDPVLRGCINGSQTHGQDQDVTRGRIEGLTALDCDGHETPRDLTGLQHAQNLISLELRSTELNDLAPIAELESLKNLTLSEVTSDTLAGMPNLPQLEELTIAYSSIADLDVLPQLPNLTNLGIRGHRGALNPSGLDRFSLTSLTVTRSEFTDLESLPYLPNLETLNLQQNDITDASSLARFEALEALNLSENVDLKLASVPALSKLNSLYLNYNDLSDLSDLEGFEQLTFLGLSSNEFTQFPNLDGFARLEYLDVSRNRILDLTPATQYPRVTNIFAVDQYINLPDITDGTTEPNPLRQIDGSPLSFQFAWLAHGPDKPEGELCVDEGCSELYFSGNNDIYDWEFDSTEVIDGVDVAFSGTISRYVAAEESSTAPLGEAASEPQARADEDRGGLVWMLGAVGAGLLVLVGGGFLLARRGRDGG